MKSKKITPPVIDTFYILSDGHVYVDSQFHLTMDMHKALRIHSVDDAAFIIRARPELDTTAKETLRLFEVRSKTKVIDATEKFKKVLAANAK